MKSFDLSQRMFCELILFVSLFAIRSSRFTLGVKTTLRACINWHSLHFGVVVQVEAAADVKIISQLSNVTVTFGEWSTFARSEKKTCSHFCREKMNTDSNSSRHWPTQQSTQTTYKGTDSNAHMQFNATYFPTFFSLFSIETVVDFSAAHE